MPDWGVDVAHFQGNVDWPEVAAEGFAFAFAKATQGVTFTDSRIGRNLRLMPAAGILPGVYHYLSRWTPARAQVAHFLKVVGPLDGLAVMLDWEHGSARKARKWVKVYRERTGGRGVLGYISRGHWAAIGRPDLRFLTAVANAHYVTGTGYASNLYQKVPGHDWDPYGGQTPLVLQFTARARVAGQRMDADACRDIGVLRDLAGAPQGRPPVDHGGHDDQGWTEAMVGDAPTITRDSTRAKWVRTAQGLCGARGHPTTVDGVFGPRTEHAVKGVQRDHRITVDGIVGPHTWRALFTGRTP